MGKPRVIAETGAGQHGVATATACALLGLECVVYMGTEDMRRQAPNVERMRLLGAEVARSRPAPARSRRRSAPRSATGSANVGDHALRDRLGGRPGAVPGARARPPAGDRRRGARAGARAEGALPARVIACVGGGSNAIGTFYAFLDDADVELIGVEAAGEGLDSGRHGASLVAGRDRASCTARCRRCSPTRRARSSRRTRSRPASTTPASAPSTPSCATRAAPATTRSPTTQALAAFRELARLEGIMPALEPAHAIAWLSGRTRGPNGRAATTSCA